MKKYAIIILFNIALISFSFSANQQLEEGADYSSGEQRLVIRQPATQSMLEYRTLEEVRSFQGSRITTFDRSMLAFFRERIRIEDFSSRLTFDFSSITAAAGAPPPPRRPDYMDGLLRDSLLREQPSNPWAYAIPFFLDHLFNDRHHGFLSREFNYRIFFNTIIYRDIWRNLLSTFTLPPFITDRSSAAVGGDPEVVGQEALMGQRQRVIDDYTTMATTEPSAKLVDRFLPSPDRTDATFMECFKDLNTLYDVLLAQKGISDAVKFRLETAKWTLNLMSGDESIEHHPISRIEQYARFSYENLPTSRQLLILAWKLSEVELEEFVVATLAENCCTPAKWQEWKRPFGSHFAEILSYRDFGQSLRADQEHGGKFIQSIVAFLELGEQLPAAGTARIMANLAKDLLKRRAEKIVPLTEALFMVMRGHNTALLNSTEPNRPACAEGAYIGLLGSISEILPGSRSFAGITLEDCTTFSLSTLQIRT